MRIKIRLTIYALMLWFIASVGCTGSFVKKAPPEKPEVVRSENFLLVTATRQDTLSTLADAHLNDAGKAWLIAHYNQIKSVTPGQQVVIPLTPVRYGGLFDDGYQTVPILFYPHMAIRPNDKKSVAARDFIRQVTYLQENDFVTISLDQFDAFLHLADELPPNAVMISFDTADRWVYDIAYPTLKAYGMKAALFIPADQIGQPGKLTWPLLKKMAANGISIGSHGPDIRAFNKADVASATRSINKYIAQATKRIESQLRRPCRDFSTPFNDINDLTAALLKKHGYRTGLTRNPGQNPFFTHDFSVRRSIILGHKNLHQFGRNLITFKKARLQ